MRQGKKTNATPAPNGGATTRDCRAGATFQTCLRPIPLTESEAERLLTDLANALQPEGLRDLLLIVHHFAYDADTDDRDRLCTHLEKEAMPEIKGFDELVRSTLAEALAERRREWKKTKEA